MKNERGFIQYILAIAVVLTIVILSQQPALRTSGKVFFTQAAHQVNAYWLKTEDWLKASIYPKVSGEVTKAKASASKEIATQKNNLAQTLWNNFKNYFAQKFDAAFGASVK